MALPLGYSGASAIQNVRLRTNEPSLPNDANLLVLLNTGLEQVEGLVGGIRLWATYPTIPGQTTVALNNDVQDIITASWSSTGDPMTAGSLVYPLQQFDQGQFMDNAAGFPAVGFGPPTAFFLYQDFGTGPAGNLAPPPQRQLTTAAGTSDGYNAFVCSTYGNDFGESLPSLVSFAVISPTEIGQYEAPPPYGNAKLYTVYAASNPNGPFLKQGTGVPGDSGFTLPVVLADGNPAPTIATASAPSGGSMAMQLYPAAMQGQVNLYYRARPQLWADTSSTSFTNLDTLAQEAVILWTCCRVLENRQRADESQSIFMPQFNQRVEEIKEKIQKRTTVKWGQVRDVTGRTYPSAPGSVGYW